jgi:hypothetical protein
VLAEGDAIGSYERHAFAPEALLHDVRGLEVALAGQHAVAIYHAVAGQVGPDRFVEGPPDNPGRPPAPEVLGDVAIRGDTTRRDPGNDLPDALEERRF